MSAEVADLLDRAAERLRTKGWRQGDFGLRSGPNCAGGAINWEALISSALVRDRAWEALRRQLGARVTHWNDAPGRTVEQVLDVFARAAAAERAAAEGTGDPSDGTP